MFNLQIELVSNVTLEYCLPLFQGLNDGKSITQRQFLVRLVFSIFTYWYTVSVHDDEEEEEEVVDKMIQHAKRKGGMAGTNTTMRKLGECRGDGNDED